MLHKTKNLNQSKGAMLLKKQNITANHVGTASNSDTFMKQIGKANYRVRVHFSPSSADTFNDKVLRLVKADCTATVHGKVVIEC